MSANRALRVFPSFCAALGGAQCVEQGARYAWITRADGRKVRLLLSQLPPAADWTSFSLANAAAKAHL